MKKTLYQILGVRPDASKDEIAAAYRAALAQTATQQGAIKHTDRPQLADPDASMLLRGAYQVLSNDVQRAFYDASLAMAQKAATTAPGIDGGKPQFSALASGAGSWTQWAVGIVLVALVIGWWQWRKPAERRAPTIATSKTSETAPETQAAASPAPRGALGPPPVAQSASAPATMRQTRTAEDIFEQVAASVARIDVLDASGHQVGGGSGVVIGIGSVITNCHVALRGPQVSVKVGNEVRRATVMTADEELDLCRLSVAGLRAPAVEIGTVSSLRTGQKVFAIGSPRGLDLTLSEGIVSSLRRIQGGTLVQTTAPTSPGSSGGGLFNGAGQLVGITTFGHPYGQNLNFALPADWIDQMQSRSAAASPSKRFFAQTPVAGSELTPLIIGNWWCHSPLTDRNGEYAFSEDGALAVVVGGKVVVGKYWVRGKALLLRMRTDAISLAIDELTAQKMILRSGEGWHLVCERR